METGMIELLEKISRSTSYLAVAGTVALMFLLIFAQHIFGAKTTHSQLKKLIEQTEKMGERLERIEAALEDRGPGDGPGKAGGADASR